MEIVNGDILEVLQEYFTVEKAASLHNATLFLTSIADHNAITDIDATISIIDTLDKFDAKNRLEHAVVNRVNQHLIGHGVQMDVENNLDISVAVIEALHTLESWGDPYSIYGAISDPDTPEHAIADVTGLLTIYESYEVLPLLLEVNYMLIDTMREVIETNINNLPPEYDNDELKQARERYLSKIPQTKDTFISSLIKTGFTLNLTFVDYLDALHDIEWNKLDVSQAVEELLYIGIGSNTPQNKLADVVLEAIETYTGNLDYIQKAKSIIPAILGEIDEKARVLS